jgi:NhaA family Na+:H+ antiporter
MAESRRTRGRLAARAERSAFTRRFYLPAHEFVRIEWVGSALLLAAAVVALVLANSAWSEGYHHLWETYITLDLGVFEVRETLHHWINDGLMAVFFFVVGLEIKREILHGNLSDPRQAALPALVALGGMIVPALIYVAVNPSGPALAGWGVPMATDIAFALGVLGLLGRRVPSALRLFLLALAIVDDLGAILVIAVFYTSTLDLQALGIAGCLVIVVLGMQRAGVRAVGAYAIVAFLLWAAVLESGVHATLAGVVLGALTPAVARVRTEDFGEAGGALLTRMRDAAAEGRHDEVEATLGTLEELTTETESPLERMERLCHPWSAFFVLPLFALANAGVSLSGEVLAGAVSSPVTLGIFLGLLVGKVVGVTGVSWLVVKTGVTTLPPGVSWRHVTGVGLLAGIGFTVALFIAQLAFVDPAMVEEAKIGILAASVVAGFLGYAFLGFGSKSPAVASAGGQAP